MISANDPKEKACALALQALAQWSAKIATDPLMSLDDKMKTLQWIYKKIPEINKLLVYIKTREISK